jgi:hypothetical protein
VRSHVLQNKRSYSGGYIIGSETYIPAKDYFTKDTIDLSWKYAFERQWLFYKLWGRLLYDPATKDHVFKVDFIRRYGKQAEQLLIASTLAGNTPLRLASYFDCGWDFTLYSEGMMALDNTTKRVEYISVDRLIKQPPLDTSFISIADYVKRVMSKSIFNKKEITPLMLAEMLEKDCKTALSIVSSINASKDKALLYEIADIKAWSYLGLHLAEKIKGAVALQTYRSRGDEINKQNAIKHLQVALAYWDSVINVTRPLYKDMPLVHLSQQGGKETKENFYLTFHWEKIRPDVAKDIETAQQAVTTKQ